MSTHNFIFTKKIVITKGEVMNDELVQRTNKFIMECGTKARFICTTLNIDEAFFCRWRKSQKKFQLKTEHSKALDQFLKEKGY